MYRLKAYGKARCILRQRSAALVVTMIMVAVAHAGETPALGELSLPSGSTQTSLGGRMRLFDTPIDIRVFGIPLPIAQTARALGERYPSLSDMGLYPQRVVLSGHVANQFWVVNLESDGPRRTRGSLSILTETEFSSESAVQKSTASPRGVMSSFSWWPAEARLRLQLEQEEGGGRNSTQVWTSTSSVESVRSAIRQGLQQGRWQAETDTPNTSLWRRKHSLLQISITAIDGGTGILLLHHDGAKS
jgi:hypothetical protein